MKNTLVLATILLGACAGAPKRSTEASTPVAAAPSQPRSNIPPLDLPLDSSTGTDTAAAAKVADIPVTVLPTIIGHATKPAQANSIPVGGVSRSVNDDMVRIAVALGRGSVRISATGAVGVYDSPSGKLVATLRGGDSFTAVMRDGLIVSSGSSINPTRGPLIARPAEAGAFVSFGGHRYRGEIGVAASGEALSVINRVAVEDYLRGVVPLEIGTDRTSIESAAVEAQAIAARSFTYTRMDDSRPYDMVATVTDQVYGGVDAERPLSDAAVAATHNMVMMYDGKVINAPYHANSGGATAAASEVWRSADEPYLVSVSDRIPGTDHYYGEDAPRFHWTRTIDANALASLLDRYLPQYSLARRGDIGTLRQITETGRTASGRVAGLVFVTDRGSFTVRGNDVRFVLRATGGDILPSTLFTFDQTTDRVGRLVRLVINGSGNGHGVGMDQWGAIARARAGQDALTILRTYYPGTTIGRVI
ncbi:MAG: SpoIID/LytB domain-containing protein [Gemmatimonadaceae bacterium]